MFEKGAGEMVLWEKSFATKAMSYQTDEFVPWDTHGGTNSQKLPSYLHTDTHMRARTHIYTHIHRQTEIENK